MKDLFKKIAKATAVFFAVGVALAFAAPYLGSMIGLDPVTVATNHEPLWTGIFFGAFGGIVPIVESAADFVFGDGKEKSVEKEKSEAKQINIVIQQAPEHTHEKHGHKWRDKMALQKLVQAAAEKSAQI